MNKYNPVWEDGEAHISIQAEEHKDAKSRFVCAKYGLVGTGQHGAHASHFYNPFTTKKDPDEDIVPYHHGDGGLFRRMRDFMLNNLGVEDEDPAVLESGPAQVLFATNSSTREPRASLRLDLLMNELETKFDKSEVQMVSTIMHKMPIEEQARMLSRTKVLFTAVGGGTFPAMFLPPGSHLVLFYVEGLVSVPLAIYCIFYLIHSILKVCGCLVFKQ
ncbi:MAG: hypothetical protein SGILL_009411 [Bacillariaceae sp.]